VDESKAPRAVISTPHVTGLTAHLRADESSDPEGAPLTYRWDFGDGQSGTGENLAHTYGEAGRYTVTLTVSADLGSDTVSVEIQLQAPSQSFPEAFDATAEYLQDVHVAPPPVGDDSSGDGSPTAPYATIGQAISVHKHQAGTRIRVGAGTYEAVGDMTDIQGRADNPIAIVADGQVLIDAADSDYGLLINAASYLVIEGLTFQNAGRYGLHVNDGLDHDRPVRHLVLRNLHFRQIGGGGNDDCLKISGADDFYISGSEFEGCNQGEAIDMVGCHNGLITGNFFHDVTNSAVQTKGGSSDITLHGNRFEDIPHRAINAGGSTDSIYFRPLDAAHEAAGIWMIANTFLRTGSSPVAFVGCQDCIFTNNTIVDPQNYVALITEENTHLAAGSGGFFVNNLIVFDVADMDPTCVVNTGPNARPETYTFGWNLWYARDDDNFGGPVYHEDVPREIHAVIQQDPLLIDPSRGDFRIPQGSPAQGAGTTMPAQPAFADHTRALYGDPPSIGAFELGETD
jgi:PKD repeat protein